ncbi:MAG: 50S ribosomal protein L5 [Candidatus Pacebacteria bacterium]|jgi:large subunit ribosomal protein L5|nr:50S ribosomal protein L5 [Candidatus Paceibacterota bacterium]MBT3511521.1 50S ribosomal protein L5 [Candidatus Paceibacterota bacterium]MBT4005009.1 50S ribosomal protein L5 [Candidatus Paceibacterota bacterium]MBT4358785.1 50S ribosomal protein L5 [Candidatus Paceibacterota bacterium]MBT4680593.1 50S ribosomal protein L5 [Candidatus Paceibacterota bacterium]
MNRLQEKYSKKIAPQLQKELKMSSLMAVPKVNKIVINMGVTQPTEPRARWQIMDNIIDQFKIITGQKPNVTLARKAIAGFTLREGDPVGAMVTLRGLQMWEFLDKLVSITLPRVKDFQGVSRKAFDGRGNYNLGLEEQIVFPEINYDLINQIRGLQVTIVTSTKNDQESFRLLELLGMPFEKENHG